MPMRSSAVDSPAISWTGRVDARWTMAYAAGVGRSDEQYLDTTRPGGVVAHPVFPVAPEWQLLTDPRRSLGLGVSREESARAVHVSHDIVLHRPVRPDQDVTVTASVAGVQTTNAGALLTMRFDGAGADGPLWTSRMCSIYRGVDVDGNDHPPATAPATIVAPAPSAVPVIDHLDLWRGAAHIYTECARIWNPIHTDVAVAKEAELPYVILHGTATLAHGVSHAMAVLGVDAAEVKRLGGSFRAMVQLPSTISRVVTAVAANDAERVAHFEVRTAAGDLAVGAGFVQV